MTAAEPAAECVPRSRPRAQGAAQRRTTGPSPTQWAPSLGATDNASDGRCLVTSKAPSVQLGAPEIPVWVDLRSLGKSPGFSDPQWVSGAPKDEGSLLLGWANIGN